MAEPVPLFLDDELTARGWTPAALAEFQAEQQSRREQWEAGRRAWSRMVSDFEPPEGAAPPEAAARAVDEEAGRVGGLI